MRKQEDLVKLSQKEAIILGILLSGKCEGMYGLEILDESAGLLKRGTLYVTLQRMEEKRLLESRQEARPKPEVGIPRRMYFVSGLGSRAFQEYKVSHQLLTDMLQMA